MRLIMFWKRKKPSNQYFISIGAGVNQIPLIKEAKRNGFQVIAVDMNASAPGFYHCDLKIQESIEDYESIYITLREMLVDGKISAIMTKSYGNAIITTAYLCEKFGLPFLPFEESRKFLNKKITKKIYIEIGIPAPPAINITSKTKISGIKENLFPVIVKPQTGHAKMDVKLLKTAAELEKFVKHHALQDFIFEHFVAGDEIICAGLIHEKKYCHILMSDKKTTPHPYFADLLHTAPSKHQHLINNTIEIGQKIADAFNIHTAPLIMEFIVDQEQNLYMLEAVPEFGGEFIPDIMIPAATGYSHLGNTIKAASASDFKAPSKLPVNNAVAVKYITGTDGILASCNTDAVKKIDDVIFTRIFKHIGDKTAIPSTNHDRIGVIVASGKTVLHAVESAESAEKEMNIRIRNENNKEDADDKTDEKK
jgi:biotin carboxylase